MNQGKPSRTALGVAMRRALHQLCDGPELVLQDPFAEAILGERWRPFPLFLTPEEMAAELASFSTMDDLGAPELSACYFGDRADGWTLVRGAGRIVCAWR